MDGEGLTSVLLTENSRLQVLASLAKDKRFLREISGSLKPEYFEQELHSIAASSILDHWRAHKSIISRAELVEGMATRLKKELRLKDPREQSRLVLKPVEEFVRKLWRFEPNDGVAGRAEAIKFCQKQEMKIAFEEAKILLEQKDTQADDVRPLIHRVFRKVIAEQEQGIDFFPETADLTKRLSRISAGKVRTGFKKLDRWMGGGMGPGTETVIMAPPKCGKSSTLINMSMNALLKGSCVVYFTHEISETIIDLRYTARISNLKMKDIERDPKIQEKAIKARAVFWSVHKPRLLIKGYPSKMATPETMRNYLYWVEGELALKPSLVVIDYADIVRSTKNFGPDGERFIQADVYEQIRAMAQEFDVPVLTASQCNRASMNKPIIRMEDIGEAFAKCAIADHLIAICSTKKERREKKLRLFYAGSREGETGRAVRIVRDWEKCYMEELEEVPEEELEDGFEGEDD